MPATSIRNQAAPPASTDALIIGGGPAGLAAAIALRRRGLDCVVVEARPPAVDKACGEGLLPDACAALAQLGVALTANDGQHFRGIRFMNAAHVVEAPFPNGEGLGVRRLDLHTLLAARAEALGAHVMWQSRAELSPHSEDLRNTTHTASINERPIRYRWLIGADGHASAVRRWAGLDRAKEQSLRYGFRTHYRVDPANNFDMVEVHWGRRGQLYLTPVAPDCVCVVYLSRNPHPGKLDLPAEFPQAARRLAGPNGLDAVTPQRGAVSATLRLRCVATGHIALIGDASGSADSITGEGLAVSFRQALALADAIAAGSLASYELAHSNIACRPHAMGALMLMLDRRPRLRAHAMRVFATAPALFRELLEAHTGARSLVSTLLRRAPQFSWRFGSSLITSRETA